MTPQETLFVAGRLGDATTVQALLGSRTWLGLKPVVDKDQAETSSGAPPLLHASYAGHRAVVSALLKAKADVQARDAASGSTALMYASAYGHLQIARMLVESGGGAALSAQDCNGHTALSIARQYDQAAIASYLGAAEAAQEAAQRSESEALLVAAGKGDLRAVMTMLEAMDLPEEPRDPVGGETALILVSRYAKAEGVVRALLTASADVHARDRAGWTALLWASDAGHAASVRALLGAGADVHAEDEDGNTAIDLATIGDRARASAPHMQVAALLRRAAAAGKERQEGAAVSAACAIS